jgi:glutamine amidotransferase
MTVAIIKYGMGNVASVQKAIRKLGYNSIITSDYDQIQNADFIILPGVGSFCAGMENLQKLGLVDILTKEVVYNKKPFLGICLGMQLLATIGNEPNREKGLGWIDGEVIKIESQHQLRIPHLGWNNVSVENRNEFYNEFDGLDYYFIHSYHFKANNEKDVVLSVQYDSKLVAALQKDNIYAMQFHPEKSQEAGMALLKKIIEQHAKV